VSRSRPSDRPAEEIPVQARIEAAMDTCQELDRWESIVLFSSEGLPMASHGSSREYGEADLMQFAFSLADAVRLFGHSSPVREVVIRGDKSRMLSFHFFEAWGETVILAAVTSKNRGYRRAVARLIEAIRKIH
jgi:hypothetical protein